MSQLIKKLEDGMWNIKKAIDESNRDLQSRRNFNIMVVYSPTSGKLLPKDLKKISFDSMVIPEMEMNPKMKAMHNLYEMIHSLTFSVDTKKTFKDLARFLRKRIRSNKDVETLKGRTYYMLKRDGSKLHELLEEDNVFMDEFINMQEEQRGRVHFLSDPDNDPILNNEEDDEDDEEEMPPIRRPNLDPMQTPNDIKIGFRFFRDGIEVIDKTQTIYNNTFCSEAPFKELPPEINGAIAFQIFEKLPK